MKILGFLPFILFPIMHGVAQENSILNPKFYGTGSWDEDSLGNHRVVMRVDKKADVVLAHIPWRRRDLNPEEKGIIIVNATSGHIVKNVLPVNMNREFGDILFQAEPGEYYVYYLKYIMGGRRNYPTVTYPVFKSEADQDWLSLATSRAKKLNKLPRAKLAQFQSIDQFNSFYPMEIIATEEETKHIIQENKNTDYLLFPEKRENSIRMTTDLPLKWIQDGVTNTFSGQAMKGEYYTFQIGLFAANKNIDNVKVDFSGLQSHGKNGIYADAFTCFNTEGTDWEGHPMEKECNVDQGKVQALWIGVQVPENIETGKFEGVVTVKPANAPETKVNVQLEVTGETIIAHGDNEPDRLSRLRWLNSTLAEDDGIVTPYLPLQVDGNSVRCLGREVVFGPGGFPVNIKSFYNESVTKIQNESREILSAPVRFVVETEKGIESWKNGAFRPVKKGKGAVAWDVRNEMPGLKMTGSAQMEFEGNIDYKLVLTATEDMDIKDIRLEIPMKSEATKYMMGLGKKGGFRPEMVNWKWAVEKNQDGPWVGDVNAGLQARFRDDNYSRPLNTNFYQQKPLNMPVSWANDGKGGISITSEDKGTTMITSFSGSRKIKKGEQLHFYFNLLITPFHPIDAKNHWHNRYYHSYQPIDSAIAYGANTINVHHANEINPFINYPFLRPDKMKAYIDEAHAHDLKVKIYYTVRELTNRAPELSMLRSLGEEVFSYGDGGGFSWLQEHLDSNYIAAWFVPSLKDAAIVNRGISRWHNFYIEGLHWLVENIGIDGLYIDDLAFDRTSMKRIRKVLKRGNPNSLIDLHSANQFNPRDGFANSANLYLEHFPFIDRLWFGEYFDYDLPPEFWLIEASGIPYGLMGEMLQDGGNPWRGMVFGMTSRAPWSGDPSAIWKAWDDFGIEDSEMIGYWDSACPVATDNAKVKATAYVKDDQVLIALGNWQPTDVEVNLRIDWDKLGVKKESAKLYAPGIKAFQNEDTYPIDHAITIPGGKGYLLILK